MRVVEAAICCGVLTRPFFEFLDNAVGDSILARIAHAASHSTDTPCYAVTRYRPGHLMDAMRYAMHFQFCGRRHLCTGKG